MYKTLNNNLRSTYADTEPLIATCTDRMPVLLISKSLEIQVLCRTSYTPFDFSYDVSDVMAFHMSLTAPQYDKKYVNFTQDVDFLRFCQGNRRRTMENERKHEDIQQFQKLVFEKSFFLNFVFQTFFSGS